MPPSVKEMFDYSTSATDGETVIAVTSSSVTSTSNCVISSSTPAAGCRAARLAALHGMVSSVEPGKQPVVVNIEKKRIKESPPHQSGAAIDREYEARLHDYYGDPDHWRDLRAAAG